MPGWVEGRLSGRVEGRMSGRTEGRMVSIGTDCASGIHNLLWTDRRSDGIYRGGLCFRNSQPSLDRQTVGWYVSGTDCASEIHNLLWPDRRSDGMYRGRTVLQEFTTFSEISKTTTTKSVHK